MTERKHIKHWKFATVHQDDIGDFRDIANTSGTYKVSRDGVVISSRRRELPDGWWVVLKTRPSSVSRPYNRVAITFDGEPKARMCQVSRLMLEAWIGPAPSPLHVAAHRDGKPDNDTLENLKWALPQDVKESSIVRGTWAHGETAGNARMQREQVEAARKIVIEYNVPANLLATAMGLNQIRVREWLTKTWDVEKWDGLEDPLRPCPCPVDSPA